MKQHCLIWRTIFQIQFTTTNSFVKFWVWPHFSNGKENRQSAFFKWNQASNNGLSLSDIFLEVCAKNSQDSLLGGLNFSICSLQKRNISYTFLVESGKLHVARKQQGVEQNLIGFICQEPTHLEWTKIREFWQKGQVKISLNQFQIFFFFHGSGIFVLETQYAGE